MIFRASKSYFENILKSKNIKISVQIIKIKKLVFYLSN